MRGITIRSRSWKTVFLFRRFADALAGRTIPQDAARELAVRMEEDLGVRDGVLLMSAYGMDASKA